MKAVCQIMDNMHSSKELEIAADGARRKKHKAYIENLEKEKTFLNNQIEVQKRRTVQVTRRYANPNK